VPEGGKLAAVAQVTSSLATSSARSAGFVHRIVSSVYEGIRTARNPSATEINVACRVLTGGLGQSRKQTFPFGEFLPRRRLRASAPSYIIETLVPWRDEATFAKSERCVEASYTQGRIPSGILLMTGN
jgi:hypothetical protein